MVLAFRDVTARRRIEEELIKAQKLEALGLLAGGIAHDFNNLLTVVLGSLTLIERDVEREGEAAELVADANAAIRRARSLTQQLLTFSRGGAPIREAAAIAQLIADSAALALSESAVRCETSLPDPLWMVRIDAGQIHQVLNNLLINAAQAMPEGGVVRIRGRNLVIEEPSPHPLAPGPYVLIEIEDEGPGIPEQHLPKIFDPYFTTKETGSGLGLATAYSIVKNHEGFLDVESALGRGATFRIHLPAVPEAAAKPEESAAVTLRGEGRILVLEDEEMVAAVIGMMLAELGYRAELTKEGRETVERYHQARQAGESFDAVILDLVIPGGWGGKETLERLRRIDPQVKAIVASGYSGDPVMSRYQEYGFQAVIPKPFGVAELGRVLSQVLPPQPSPEAAHPQ